MFASYIGPINYNTVPLSVIILRILAISVSAPVGQFSTNCKSSGDAIPIARTCEKIEKQKCRSAARVNENERTRISTSLR